MGGMCLGPIRKGSDYLSSTSCKQHFHKQMKCSNMTRKQIEDLDRKTWTCLKCQMVEANPRPSPEDTETQTQYKTENKTWMEAFHIRKDEQVQ